ncbi:MAG: hypothetical protein KGH94_02810 [Candidatus Micrarchaeota archaeon]|nr:hypothetical protein [Candidatus Micrarchaeota archaeon]
MKQTRTMVISHNADIDGIGCAALLQMRYKIKDSDIFLIDYSIEALQGVEKAIKRMKPKDVDLFITDLAANDQKVGLFLSIIKTIKKGGGKVRWFDHHPWSEQAVKRITPECERIICGERNECATEITSRELGLEGKFVGRFTRICHYSDFNLKPKDSKSRSLIKTYAIGITKYNIDPRPSADKNLKALARTLAGGELSNPDIVHAAREFDRISKARIGEMKKELVPIGSKIAVGFARTLNSTNACYHIIKKSGRDIGIFVNLDAKRCNIRSVKSNINPLAASLGGGGHPHASGFSFDPKKYPVNTQKGRVLLLKRIERAAKSNGIL